MIAKLLKKKVLGKDGLFCFLFFAIPTQRKEVQKKFACKFSLITKY